MSGVARCHCPFPGQAVNLGPIPCPVHSPAAPVVQGDEALREAIRDELSGWPIGSGYYGTTVDTDAAREMADALLPVVLADRDAHAREVAAAEFNAGTTILADLLRLTYDVQQDSKLGSAEGREAERVADAFRERIGRHCDERNGRRRLDRAAALDGEGGK